MPSLVEVPSFTRCRLVPSLVDAGPALAGALAHHDTKQSTAKIVGGPQQILLRTMPSSLNPSIHLRVCQLLQPRATVATQLRSSLRGGHELPLVSRVTHGPPPGAYVGGARVAVPRREGRGRAALTYNTAKCRVPSARNGYTEHTAQARIADPPPMASLALPRS